MGSGILCRYAAGASLPRLSRLPRDAKSVIVCLLGYYAGERAHNISRYAWARDYHLLVEELLSPVAERMRETWQEQTFAVFTDNSPIREVTAARLAGLGFIGNNGLLISPAYGSYHFIAEIVTDLWLEPSEPVEAGCGECRRLPGCLSDRSAVPFRSGKKPVPVPYHSEKRGSDGLGTRPGAKRRPCLGMRYLQ